MAHAHLRREQPLTLVPNGTSLSQDVQILASASPPGARLYIATPPLFVVSETVRSQIVDDGIQRLPLSASASAKNIVLLARTLTLQWNAEARRRRRLGVAWQARAGNTSGNQYQ